MKKTITLFVLFVLLFAGYADAAVVKLDIWERINTSRLVPQKTTFEKAVVAVDVKKKLDFTQEEIERFGIVTEGNLITWSTETDEEVEIDFTYLETEMLQKAIEDLSEKKEVDTSPKFVTLCKKLRSLVCEKSI